MFEFFLVAMFQAVAGAPAPAPVTDPTAATGSEHAGHAHTAPAETTAPASETPAETPAPPQAETAPAEPQQQASEQRRERVCREEASSGSRLRSRRSC